MNTFLFLFLDTSNTTNTLYLVSVFRYKYLEYPLYCFCFQISQIPLILSILFLFLDITNTWIPFILFLFLDIANTGSGAAPVGTSHARTTKSSQHAPSVVGSCVFRKPENAELNKQTCTCPKQLVFDSNSQFQQVVCSSELIFSGRGLSPGNADTDSGILLIQSQGG